MKFVVFVSLLAASSRAQNYCSICQDHTACSYKSWDPELATIAQYWADQCHFGHDTCRNVRRFYVGQNVFMSMGSERKYTSDWARAIMAWYNEVSSFNSGNISPFKFSEAIGHYSQMMWDTTYKIGCGFTMYQDAESKTYNRYYVCNYGPGGNVISGTMYKTGDTCSACPNSCNAGLCETQIDPFFNASFPERPQIDQPTPSRPIMVQRPPVNALPPIPSSQPAQNTPARPPVVYQPPVFVHQPQIPPYYYPYSKWFQDYYWPFQNWKWYW